MDIKTQLIELIADKRLPHAILLESMDSRLCYDTSVFVAQALLCENLKPDGACGECTPCIKVQTNNHPDIYILSPDEASKAIKVDMIRALRDDAFLKPNEAPCKIYIILCAEAMNDNAQNALLKILEEPPENVYFILSCTGAERLLQTILSRVETYKLDAVEYTADHADIPEELTAVAREIALALCSDNELDLLTATNKLTAVKKDIPTVLDLLAIWARNACMSLYGIETESKDGEIVKKLASSKKKTALLNLIDKTDIAKEKLAQNVNTALFVTWLCAQLRRL